jgi:arylformamidase
MDVLDISVRLSGNVPSYPGNPPFRLDPVKRIARGDSANVSALHLGTHTGTHVDPPLHFFDGRPGADALPLDVLIGPARVVHLPGLSPVTADRLAGVDLTGVTRLLVRTGNSELWSKQEFDTGYAGLTVDAAERVAEAGVALVGVDYLSVECFRTPGAPAHHVLLGKGIVVVEGLDLSQVEAGEYELICLPLRLADADGAPARAVLRRTEDAHDR